MSVQLVLAVRLLLHHIAGVLVVAIPPVLRLLRVGLLVVIVPPGAPLLPVVLVSVVIWLLRGLIPVPLLMLRPTTLLRLVVLLPIVEVVLRAGSVHFSPLRRAIIAGGKAELLAAILLISSCLPAFNDAVFILIFLSTGVLFGLLIFPLLLLLVLLPILLIRLLLILPQKLFLLTQMRTFLGRLLVESSNERGHFAAHLQCLFLVSPVRCELSTFGVLINLIENVFIGLSAMEMHTSDVDHLVRFELFGLLGLLFLALQLHLDLQWEQTRLFDR